MNQNKNKDKNEDVNNQVEDENITSVNNENTQSNEIRNILILCFIISFVFPSYWVGGKSSIWWQYPMPIQIIRWFFIY